MEIKRAYKFRFYPTPEQELILPRRLAALALLYNYMRFCQRTDAWFERKEKVGYHETSAMLTATRMAARQAYRDVGIMPASRPRGFPLGQHAGPVRCHFGLGQPAGLHGSARRYPASFSSSAVASARRMRSSWMITCLCASSSAACPSPTSKTWT